MAALRETPLDHPLQLFLHPAGVGREVRLGVARVAFDPEGIAEPEVILRREGEERHRERDGRDAEEPAEERALGERGHLLSGGQRQAVALARAMLVDPRVLFLDEPSSSMDMATERQLIGHLGHSLQADHTVLIATHRFSLLKLVTRIIVVDNGKIAADGERDAVLAQLKVSAGGDQG